LRIGAILVLPPYAIGQRCC